MQYEVWVASADGGNRIDLVPKSDDSDAVAELVGALVRVVSGPLSIGVTVSSGETAPAPAAMPQANQRRPPHPPAK